MIHNSVALEEGVRALATFSGVKNIEAARGDLCANRTSTLADLVAPFAGRTAF